LPQLLLLALLSQAAGLPAPVSPPRTIERRAPFSSSLVFNVGFASAVGELGVAFEHDLAENFAIEAGGGFGWTGAQLSLMPKLVFGSEHDRFITGAGLSVAVPAAKLEDGTHEVVVWLNVDLGGYEHRAEGGFVFTISAGFTTSLSSGITAAIDENNAGSVNLSGYTLPQVRLGFGFGL
jgi:hypothetical protein